MYHVAWKGEGLESPEPLFTLTILYIENSKLIVSLSLEASPCSPRPSAGTCRLTLCRAEFKELLMALYKDDNHFFIHRLN